MRRYLLSCVVVALLAPIATAQSLTAGSAAPPLQIHTWVKGDPVQKFGPGKIYVVEFWAVWCGPCLASMPHLSQLQAKWRDKGVTIVGVSSEDPHNTLAAVKTMVTDKDGGMGYTVAWDDGAKTKDAYMTAAGMSSIPCSFVVDGNGKIAYIGHPMLLDMPLAGLVDGTWDPVKGQQKLDGAMRRLSEIPKDIMADSESSLARVKAFVTEFPMFAERVASMQFQQLLQAKKFDRAFSIAAQLVDAAIAEKDPEALNEIAWTIVDPSAPLDKRDLDIAMRAAGKAVELTKEKNGNLLDTLARTWFWKQDYKQALALQKKAVALGGNAELEKTVSEYELLVAAAEKAAGETKNK